MELWRCGGVAVTVNTLLAATDVWLQRIVFACIATWKMEYESSTPLYYDKVGFSLYSSHSCLQQCLYSINGYSNNLVSGPSRASPVPSRAPRSGLPLVGLSAQRLADTVRDTVHEMVCR